LYHINGTVLWDAGINLVEYNPNQIFDDFPWLLDQVNPNNCSTEKIEFYPGNEGHPFAYLLITAANGSTTLYNQTGQVYCQQTTSPCIDPYVAAYGINSTPYLIWTCGTSDCICPQVDAPVCGADGRMYDNSCLASCAGVEIEEVGNCTRLQLTNIGCRSIQLRDFTGSIRETAAPGATFTYVTFFHTLTVGSETLEISTSGDIDSGGCDESSCSINITNSQCRSVGIYDENDNLITTIAGAFGGIPIAERPDPQWTDPQPLVANETRIYVFKENNLILGRDTVSCQNSHISTVSKFPSGCTDAVGLSQITNSGCREIQVLSTSGTLIRTVPIGEQTSLTVLDRIYILLVLGIEILIREVATLLMNVRSPLPIPNVEKLECLMKMIIY